MGRPKGSKNKPKPLPPDVLAAMEYAAAQGFAYQAPAVVEPPKARVPERFRDFLPLVKIRRKKAGALIPWDLYDEQEEIVDWWESTQESALVLKARRIGISLIFAGLFFHEWLKAEGALQTMHLANKRTVAREIMGYHKTFLQTLPPEFRPKLTTDQAELITRQGGASVASASARGGDAARGFGPYLLHVAEFAFIRNPDDLRSAAFNAVPTEEGGRICLESTANYRGDAMHQEFQEAQAGEAELAWKRFFFPWNQHEAYRVPARSLVRTPEEEGLANRHELDDEQLAFRRMMIAKLRSPALFRRDFPLTVDEAYSSTRGAWFTADEIELLQIAPIDQTGTTILEKYDPRERYAVGCDCGSGTGGDFTTAIVWNVRTERPVAVYRSNADSPDVSADVFWHLSTTYGGAMILVERNTWGIPHLNKLRTLRANLYQEVDHEFDGEKPGDRPHDFVTTAKTRTEVLEAFRSKVLSGALTLVDGYCWAELGGARVDDKGEIVFPRTKEGHGDVLYAYALAIRCARHVPVAPPPPSPVERRRAAAERDRVIRATIKEGRY